MDRGGHPSEERIESYSGANRPLRREKRAYQLGALGTIGCSDADDCCQFVFWGSEYQSQRVVTAGPSRKDTLPKPASGSDVD